MGFFVLKIPLNTIEIYVTFIFFVKTTYACIHVFYTIKEFRRKRMGENLTIALSLLPRCRSVGGKRLER